MSDHPNKIGEYPVERELGRGGMGVVYLGRDPKLDRLVAIKVLPDHLAADPERLARFEREAKLLASLSHPNIAGIFGFEESDGQHFLILEYVEGENLSDRLKSGALGVREALKIARQIATAIEVAHENGIIHRDLKPGNVRLTPDDEVKVLDFGLAKGSVSTESTGGVADSPTLTFQMTGEGVILGTTAYLSPEQARGKTVNRRADIWAFGCVLYECLTGKQAFDGETVSDTIARILERQIDFNTLPPETPPRIRALLQRCLEKDEKKRLRDIGDARLEIEEVLAADESSSAVRVDDSHLDQVVPVRPKQNWARAAVFLLVGAVIASSIWVLVGAGGKSGGGNEVTRLSIQTPPELQVNGVEFAEGGETLVFHARKRVTPENPNPKGEFYVRRLSSFEFRPLAGTEGALGGAVSGDGKSLYYAAPLSERTTQKGLFRVPIDGSSPPISVGEWKDEYGFFVNTRNGDSYISTQNNHAYVRIPSGATTPDEVIPFPEDISPKYRCQLWNVLPGDRGILMNCSTWGASGYLISLGVLDLKSGEVRILIEEGSRGFFSPTGHLVFTRGENLLAVPFDLGKLEVSGQPVALMNGIRTTSTWQNGDAYLSDSGTLLYAPGGQVGDDRKVAIFGSDGQMRLWSDAGYAMENNPVLSPDGRRFITVVTNANGVYEVWGSDYHRPRLRRLIALPAADCDSPRFSPDGNHIVYTRNAITEEDGIYITDWAGRDVPKRIVAKGSHTNYYWASDWSPHGNTIFLSRTTQGQGDICTIKAPAGPATELEPTELIATPADEFGAVLSPDGEWLAYVSDESGQLETYVAPYDGNRIGIPISVSAGIGDLPVWSHDGHTLYFGAEQRGFMQVRISMSPTFTVSDPKVYLEESVRERFGNRYSSLAGGEMLVILRGDEENEITRYDLILNWLDEFREKMSGQLATR